MPLTGAMGESLILPAAMAVVPIERGIGKENER